MKLAFIAVLLLPACATPEFSEATSAEIRCTPWGCGTNSPTVGDGLIFDELDSSQIETNRSGLRIVGVTSRAGTPAGIRVQRHSFIAIAFDGTRFEHGNLVDTIITLKGKPGQFYEVRIAGVHEQDIVFWAGSPEFVPFYEFQVRRLGELKWTEYACKYDVIGPDPAWTGVEHAALVFQWDRYDPEHKLVTETAPDDPWFNLACAASAPAKMHLLRHTRAGSYDVYGGSFDTTVKERQTMLKMLTADYCGKGHAFTRDGQPLQYRDAHPWSIAFTPGQNEALWSAEGALNWGIIAVGAAESMVPLTLAFGALTFAWLCVAIGMRRNSSQ